MKAIKDKLAQYMDSWSKADRFSGTVLVCKKDNILLQRPYGYANVQYKIMNEVNTKYKIGSYTKQFTAAAILKLYESGQIELEDNIKKYIPEYMHSEGITIHHLLSHTSGIPEHTNFEEYRISESITFDIIIDRINKRELDFKVGDRAEYSNTNYVLLAKIVEIVSGMDIEAFYHEYIFKPAGLENTGVSRNEDIILELAQGYSYSGQGIINADYYDMSGAYGSGFLYSTAEDILKWIKALLNYKIITTEALKKMMTPYGYIWYMDAWVGYGCFMKDEQANEICANGLISGYIFNVWVDLKNDYAVILLGNNDTIAISKILEGIKGILFFTNVPIEIIPIAKGDIRSLDLLKKIEGRYKCKYTGGEFNIGCQDGNIFVDRLWIQEYKGTKFKLKYIDENEEQLIFACEVCDGKFIFFKQHDVSILEALYIYDTIKLPYEKIV
ncbi:beta-lactamase family protein [Clostridium sp. 19966]|uniref:serine hydrolase domain-containing protein n=1 Tax=Clostridium sp. 19966 TaxID=2768166 RepID=UPI0028DDCDC1|nr:serine hydrolase domain-containing protein [Clostridium sp. 19966]MDT8719630.1 beta-lactamase family protein [Clostridium sp. 19966]